MNGRSNPAFTPCRQVSRTAKMFGYRFVSFRVCPGLSLVSCSPWQGSDPKSSHGLKWMALDWVAQPGPAFFYLPNRSPDEGQLEPLKLNVSQHLSARLGPQT